MDTKITLQRKKFLMRHIKRMELHYFESKALDLIICKQYKLKQYVFFFPSLYFQTLQIGGVSPFFDGHTLVQYIKIIYIFFTSFFSFLLNQAASSLNSSYCYILHSDSTVFTWSGNLTSANDQELVERQLDLIKVCCLYLFS